MRSRFCFNFTSEIPVSFINTSFVKTDSLNFSVDFWQPFIDLNVENESAFICGPLLGILIEISKILKCDLTYIKTPSGEFNDNFEMMGQRLTNILLMPFPPMSINMTNVTQFMQFSRSIGDVSMISILSSKEPINSFFHLMKIFDYKIWLCAIVSYFLVSSLSALISDDLKFFLHYIAIALRQNIIKLERNQRTAFITIIWFYATMILMWAFSGMLLTFLVFATPYLKIDSIEELAQKDIKFTVFEGENAFEYINDPKEPYYEMFLNRSVVEDPENDEKENWEKVTFDKISQGIYALVSDKLFLDYYFATKLLNYSNLYRSESNQLVLPYFLPLSKHNSHQLVLSINKVICQLVESGIFETWLKETFDLNNDAIRLGFSEKVAKKYEFSPLLFKQFESLFYVLLILFLFSLVICFIEVINFKLKAIKNNNLMNRNIKYCFYHKNNIKKSLTDVKTIINMHQIKR